MEFLRHKKSPEEENLFKKITFQWALEGSTGKGVKIAVVDSGIDYTHPEIKGSVKDGVEITSTGDGKINYKKGLHQDAFGHGTACAGIIRSIAPEAEFYSVKVLGATLTGTGNVMMAGIKWAVDNGMDMANLSLGTTKDTFFANLHKIADSAYFKNCLLIGALSNTKPVSYPAVFASLIGVKAIKEENHFNFYLNPEPPVEIYARGIEVRIPWLKHGYFTTSGNSFATPVITGIMALIKAKHPYLTHLQLKCILQSLAKKWEDYGKIKSSFLNVEELSRRAGVKEDKLKEFIEKGLLTSVEEEDKGDYLFKEKDIVKSIRLNILSSQDFTVEEIKKKVR